MSYCNTRNGLSDEVPTVSVPYFWFQQQPVREREIEMFKLSFLTTYYNAMKTFLFCHMRVNPRNVFTYEHICRMHEFIQLLLYSTIHYSLSKINHYSSNPCEWNTCKQFTDVQIFTFLMNITPIDHNCSSDKFLLFRRMH